MADKSKDSTESSKRKPGTSPGNKGTGDEEEDNATRSGKDSEESDETKDGETDESKEGDEEEGEEKPKPKPAEKTLTQKAVNSIVAKALKTEREKWESERDEADAEKDKNFEQLAETRKAKIEKLTEGYATLQVTYEELVDASTAYIRAELEALPAEVLALAPVDLPTDADELEELELTGELLVKLAKWIPKAKASAATIKGDTSMPAFGKRPVTKGKPTDSERSPEDVKQGARKSGRYGF